MKNYLKRFSALLLSLVIIISVFPFGLFISYASSNTTGDIITFGSYPQSEVKDANLKTKLDSCTLSGDSTATYGGEKYKKVYFTAYNVNKDMNGYNISTVYWFKFEPIQWRVLSNTNGELFLMSEKVLDSRAYNLDCTYVLWRTCTLRVWLNKDFYNAAFSSAEKLHIK